MDGILSIVGALLVIVALNFGIKILFSTLRASGRALVGKGSFSDNFQAAFAGMSALESRIITKTLNEDGSGLAVQEVEVKGLFPPAASTFSEASFFTSVFDETSGQFEPVLSFIDDLQERDSRVFQYQAPVGRVLADQGLISWVRAGVVIPEFLQPPYSGTRKLVVVLRMADSSARSLITHGFHEKGPRIFWQTSFRFEHLFKEKGYMEAAENRDKATALTIKLAVAIAMPDGRLSEKTGNALKVWMARSLDMFSGDRQQELKEKYNAAFVDAYKLAKDRHLSLTQIVGDLNRFAERSQKYAAIELCFDVVSSEAKPDIAALRVIRLIAEALELNLAEIEKIKDQRIVHLGSAVSDKTSLEALLGIDKNWTSDQIKTHLRNEFKKWNNRLNAVTGAEREGAQRMLELIAEARKKYG